MHVEILPPEGKVKYLDQMITSVDQAPRCNTGSDALGPHSPNIDRNRHPNPTYYETDYTCSTLLSHQQQRTMPGRGLQQKNTKNMLRTTQAQNAPTHHPDQQKIKRTSEKDLRDDGINEGLQEEDSNT